MHNAFNEITSISGSGSAVEYDRVGNALSAPAPADWASAQTFTWDAWNRLVAIAERGKLLAAFQYDGLGQRTVKTSGTANREYFYSDQTPTTIDTVSDNITAVRLASPGTDKGFSNTVGRTFTGTWDCCGASRATMITTDTTSSSASPSGINNTILNPCTNPFL
jgi:hypothetical protein